jgi:Bacterial RNA polymerase, alpha chain C terminal domain
MAGCWRGARANPGTGQLADPFAVDPIRRSFGLVATCALVLFGPLAIDSKVAALVMLSCGWLAAAGFVIGLPVLLWSVGEWLAIAIRKRLHPTVDQLDISPRVAHILNRFGYHEIEFVDQISDAELMLLSNMDVRAVREIRRAIAIWKYRRWQERGFPARGFD